MTFVIFRSRNEGSGDMRKLTAMFLAGVVMVAGTARAATVVADYQFNGNLSSSVAGAPDLIATDPLGVASFSKEG